MKHIYRVEYRMFIDTGEISTWCQETVRCFAYDVIHARIAVANWALTTPTIWWFEDGELTEHRVPLGGRDVAIIGAERIADDVGHLLKLIPMPEVIPPEG
jgi:hypothetical protein